MTRPEYNINDVNTHENDARITFIDEGHRYFLDDIRPEQLVSVTTLISRFVPDRFQEFIVNRIQGSKRWWDDPTYDYYSLSAAEIITKMSSKGRSATEAGSYLHDTIHRYYSLMDLPEPLMEEFDYFEQFKKDYAHFVPVRSEWTIFHREALIAGSIDMLYWDSKAEKFVIVDWKRVKQMNFKGGDECIYPVEGFKSCNHVKYSLQLNLYKYILVQEYGLDVGDIMIVQIHPRFDNYKTYMIDDLQEVIDKMVTCRRAEVARYVKVEPS